MIILTGASGGLGKKIYKHFEKSEPIIGLTNSKSLTPSFFGINEKVDLTNPKEIEKFVKNYKNKIRNLTLINMAVISKDGLLANYPTNQILETFSINVFSNIKLVQTLLPIMISQRFGRIIHVSSIVGQQGLVGAGIYAASKTALNGYSQTLAKEYARFQITSNILSLGYFEGGLLEKLGETFSKSILKKIPAKRFGKSEDILSAIKFLRDCEYINGENINLHGGL